MSPLKATIEVTIIMLALVAMMVMMVSLLVFKTANASESLLGQLFMDFSTGEAAYTETNDFSESYGVKTTVTVTGTPCGECLRDRQPSACLVQCDKVLLTY